MHGCHFILIENTGTLDSYMTHIRQVVTCLGYGEPQILEVFKNTHRIIFGSIPHRRLKTSYRNC